jgi:UrcA family protein
MTSRKLKIMACRALTGLAAATALLCNGAYTAAAAATPDGDIPSMVVKFGDLNLSTTEGASVLYRRITAAAARVCPERTRDLQSVGRSAGCRKAAIARAVAAIPSPQLAAIHAAHGKHV